MTSGRSQLSLWALASLLCSLIVLCPIATLLGPLLGVRALVEIRRNPLRTGRGMAIIGIVVGLAATVGWGVAARWWHVHARTPMLEGPTAPLRAGLAGRVAEFQAAFHGDGAVAADAPAFLEEVRGRYGVLRGSAQRRVAPGQAAADAGWAGGRVRIPYTLQFEGAAVEADAEFVLFDDAGGLVLGFGWVALRDDELGDLVYPASAAAVAGRP